MEGLKEGHRLRLRLRLSGHFKTIGALLLYGYKFVFVVVMVTLVWCGYLALVLELSCVFWPGSVI